MIRSMTGFTRAQRVFEWGTLSVEVSSVNHRFQEISPRIPREISSLEPLVTGKLRQRLGRGKIRCSVELHWAPRFKAAVLDSAVLSNYHTQLVSLANELGSLEVPSLASLLTLPGVFESPSALSDLADQLESGLDELLEDSISGLISMRTVEGENLRIAMEGYLTEFQSLVDSIETAWNEKKDQILAETKSRIAGILEDTTVEIDQNRIAQEVAMLADKWDISEEFVRSRSHLGQFQTIVRGSISEGRKLDFLLQEMNREVNTMGSKISDAELRWMVVEAKALLEKIREQVQNVE